MKQRIGLLSKERMGKERLSVFTSAIPLSYNSLYRIVCAELQDHALSYRNAQAHKVQHALYTDSANIRTNIEVSIYE